MVKHKDIKSNIAFTDMDSFDDSAPRPFSYHDNTCKQFGWYNSGNGSFACDHKPLNFHAITALIWLLIFAIQVGLLVALPTKISGKIHKYFGRLGMIGAFISAGGMFGLALHDVFHPMENSDRPSNFTPVMFVTGLKIVICLVMSTYAIMKKNRNIDQHMIWIFRAFISSFGPPVMRVYPLILRRILDGEECFEANRHKGVMGAMFVSQITGSILFFIAQRYTQTKFWDGFIMFQTVAVIFSLCQEFIFASEHGTFLGGMIQCHLMGTRTGSDGTSFSATILESNSTDEFSQWDKTTQELQNNFEFVHGAGTW